MIKYPDAVVLVFAKAPVAGMVNTRLIPDIGVAKATRLQHDLIHKRLASLTDAGLCKVVLYCSPDITDDFFKACTKQYSVELKNQSGVDLGEKMANAIDEQSRSYNNVIIVGTDAPALDSDQVEDAIKTLNDGNDVVIVPAEDGGYVLIGMNQPHKVLFLSVPWGSERVLTKTRANVVAAGLKLTELETSWDIDRAEDYYRWLRISEGL